MRALLHAVRFFHVVPPVPRLMVSSVAIVTGAAVVTVYGDPRRGPDAVVPLLVLQVFAASAGFAASARRGYFDFVLTNGVGRVRTALVHWATSVTPGLAGWLALAAAEALLSGLPPTALSSGSVAAMFMVSTLPWALTVALPRFSGAIGWMLVCVMASTLLTPADSIGWSWREASSQPVWQSALGFIVFPTRMAGRDAAPYLVAVAPGLMVAAAAMAVALVWIHRTDIPLEAAQ